MTDQNVNPQVDQPETEGQQPAEGQPMPEAPAEGEAQPQGEESAA